MNGPSIAIEALQAFVDAALEALELALEVPPLEAPPLEALELLLLLLLPQPAAISAVSATATRIRRTFIGLASPEE